MPAETVVRFGTNRRQHPLRIDVPGGRIILSREMHGTVLVRFTADAGEIVIAPNPRSYVTEVRLLHEGRDVEL